MLLAEITYSCASEVSRSRNAAASKRPRSPWPVSSTPSCTGSGATAHPVRPPHWDPDGTKARWSSRARRRLRGRGHSLHPCVARRDEGVERPNWSLRMGPLNTTASIPQRALHPVATDPAKPTLTGGIREPGGPLTSWA